MPHHLRLGRHNDAVLHPVLTIILETQFVLSFS